MANIERKEIKYSLGLDIGIASIGWGIINLDEENKLTHIVDTGVVVIESMEDKSGNLKNVDRRDVRGARRTLRRRNYRVQEIKKLILKNFSINNIEDIYINKTNIYELKVKGLKEELTEQELARVLIHYAKHRGFKSNRKEDTSDEDGVVLNAIKKNQERKGNKYISELILSEINGVDKVKNSEEYKYSFLREDYEEEIKKLLDIQLQNNKITKEFKNAYLELWVSQRDFSEGPGKSQEGQNSYKVDYSSVFGYCSFYPNELRAPKMSITQQENTALTRLLNLSYRINDDLEWKELTKEQIEKILEEGFSKKEIRYNNVANIIDKKANIKFKSLRLSKSDYISTINTYKEKKGLTELNVAEDSEFQEVLLKKTNDKVLFSMEINYLMKKVFKEQGMLEVYNTLPRKYKDDIAQCLTFYKTDERINNYFKEIKTKRKQEITSLEWELYPEIIEKVIPKISTNKFKESASLSLKLLNEINPILKEGYKYDEAMQKLGHDHNKVNRIETIKKIKLGELNKILNEQFKNEISNPRVIRVLTKLASLIDSCVDAYGSPYFINIEVARDINLRLSKRQNIENEQLENLSSNENIKAQILIDNPNMSYSRITRYDIEKYKLYKEQNGLCMYSLDLIEKGNLLTGEYEVDHIIPYSKSHNNSIQNKCLVKKSENQNKTNMVPLEYFNKKYPDRVERFKNEVMNNSNMKDQKKENYLLKTLSDAPEQMKDGYVEGTRFITKYIIEILNRNLIFKDEGNKDKERIISHKAGYVNYFKRAMKINNLTHSLESPNYYRKSTLVIEKLELNTEEIKLTTKNIFNENIYTTSIKIVKENKNTPSYIRELNKDIKKFILIKEQIDFNWFEGKYLNKNKEIKVDIFDEILENEAYSTIKEVLVKILTILKSEAMKLVIKKNRDNHLHHALDALATAGLTRSTQQKISKYDKKKYGLLEEIKKGPQILKYAGQEKIIKTIDDFTEIENEYMEFLFPKPFLNFKKEVEAFVYQRDEDEQKRLLEDGKYRNIRVLMPVQTKKKRYHIENGKVSTKALHKETIYGVTKNQKELVKRINVNDLDNKKLEKIYDKDNRAYDTYMACKSWLENKKNTKYPILNNGRLIKKVKILDGDVQKALKIKRGYAAADLITRIDVYRKEGDNKLYFLGHNALSLVQDYQGKEVNQTLWYGRGENKINITNKLIQKNYIKICELHPGELVDLKLTKKRESLAYIVGFTSGKLEVSSPLGDNFDMEKNLKVKRESSQIYLTISTIERIQKKKINIRGEIK